MSHGLRIALVRGEASGRAKVILRTEASVRAEVRARAKVIARAEASLRVESYHEG